MSDMSNSRSCCVGTAVHPPQASVSRIAIASELRRHLETIGPRLPVCRYQLREQQRFLETIHQVPLVEQIARERKDLPALVLAAPAKACVHDGIAVDPRCRLVLLAGEVIASIAVGQTDDCIAARSERMGVVEGCIARPLR